MEHPFEILPSRKLIQTPAPTLVSHVTYSCNKQRVETRMDVAYGEEFDEAFLLELDAVEAAAVQRSHARQGVPPTPGSTSGSSNGTQHGQRLLVPAAQTTSEQTTSDSVVFEQGCSTGNSSNPVVCLHSEDMMGGLHRWKVDRISVQDDAIPDGSEDRIGQVLYRCTAVVHTCTPKWKENSSGCGPMR